MKRGGDKWDSRRDRLKYVILFLEMVGNAHSISYLTSDMRL